MYRVRKRNYHGSKHLIGWFHNSYYIIDTQIYQQNCTNFHSLIFKIFFRYFLISTYYFLYGESIIYYFKEIVLVDAFLLPFATHHRFISFVLYCIGNLKINCVKFDACHDSKFSDYIFRVRILCRQP